MIELAKDLAARGLDLAAPFATCDLDVGPSLPDFGRARCLAVVVGNTRALWPHFLAARDAAAANPLDDYVMSSVTAAIADRRAELRWAHHVPATIAIQRAAAVAGLAYLAPSHLCVHPVFGPWIALRAVIVLDADAPPPAPPLAAPCSCANGCGPALATALAAGPAQTTADLRARWPLWLAVRDACPAGRAHRYSDEQIAYHYAGSRPKSE